MEDINQEPMSPAVVDDQVPARSSSPTRSTPPPTPDAPAKRKNKWSVRHSRISNKGAMNPKPVPVTMFPRFLDLFGVGRQEEEEEQLPIRGQKKSTYNDPRDYTKSRLPYFYAMAPKKCRKGKAVVLRGRRATGIPKPYFYKPSPCRELLELFEAILAQENEQKAQQQKELQLLEKQEEEPQLGKEEEEEEQPEEEHQEEEAQLGEEEEEEEQLEEEEQEEEPQLGEEEEEPQLGEEEEEQQQPEEEQQEEELVEEEEEDDEEEEPEWAWELLEWELPQQHLQEPQVAAAAPKSPPPRQHRIRAVSRRHNGSMPVRKGLF